MAVNSGPAIGESSAIEIDAVEQAAVAARTATLSTVMNRRTSTPLVDLRIGTDRWHRAVRGGR